MSRSLKRMINENRRRSLRTETERDAGLRKAMAFIAMATTRYWPHKDPTPLVEVFRDMSRSAPAIDKVLRHLRTTAHNLIVAGQPSFAAWSLQRLILTEAVAMARPDLVGLLASQDLGRICRKCGDLSCLDHLGPRGWGEGAAS